MKCRFCGQTAPVPAATGVVVPHSLDEFLAKIGDSHLEPLTEQALEVSCDGCGSRIAFQPPEVAGTCPFCGADIVMQPKAADPMIAPDGLLPAKIPKNNAQAQVREWLQTRWFAPNALKRMARQEAISGRLSSFLGLRRRHPKPVSRRARRSLLGNRSLRRPRRARTQRPANPASATDALDTGSGRSIAAFRQRPGGGHPFDIGGEAECIRAMGSGIAVRV